MMINAVLEHVPIKLENFNDSNNDNDDSTSSNDCVAVWRTSSSATETAAVPDVISRTSSIASTSKNLELLDVVESCGNVFIYSRRKLFLICAFCDSKYANMLQFAKHLNDCHKIFYTHCDEVVVPTSSSATIADDSDSDAPTIASSISSNDSGLIVKGGFQIRFVGEGPPPPSGSNNENDVDTLPMASDVLLRHVPIKVEQDDTAPEDEKAMLDFENNIESCGNIFVMNRKKLFLICGFCEGKYANMELFATHLHQCHTIFEEETEVNQNIVPAPQPVQIKEEPEEVLVPVKRQASAAIETALPMVAIPTTGNEAIIRTPGPPALPPTASTKRKMVLRESQSDRVSSKDSDTISEFSDFSEEIPPNDEAYFIRDPQHCKFTCRKCGKEFKKLSRMLEHVRIHTGEKPYQCPVCGKRFRIKLRLTEHQMRHREVKAFKCDTCGLGCATRQDYAMHQRHHKKDKRYTCKECGKAFVRSGDLKTHQRIHSDERPFKCDICSHTFRANQNLIMHRKLHNPSKPFKCDYCEKTFRRNIDRNVHHRTHTGEKAFKCEICGQGYSARIHVRRHIETRHLVTTTTSSSPPIEGDTDTQVKRKTARKEKTFKCTSCYKVYSSKSSLEKHVKKVHTEAVIDVTLPTNNQEQPATNPAPMSPVSAASP